MFPNKWEFKFYGNRRYICFAKKNKKSLAFKGRRGTMAGLFNCGRLSVGVEKKKFIERLS